ncbi:hydroxyacid dehydrogenase [archaeon]|nr:hydroxyacid dehydrogenase [archaeon]
MKIAFFEIEDWEKEYINKNLKKHKVIFIEDELNEKNVDSVKDADAICVFIYSEVTKKLLDKLKNLKAVITRSTGFDHIDIKTCKKKRIRVFNVPNYGKNTVAEHAFTLILALSKNLIKSYEKAKKCDFDLEGLEGFDLKGKTIGVVGVGSIGKHVVKIAKGFEMNIIVCTRTKYPKIAKKIGFKYVNFNSLLKNSDIITFHVPLTKSTKHMINMKNINLIKKGAYLINTARGDIVDTTALIKALDKKILAGAGLDVLEEEELIKEESQLLSKKYSREQLCNVLENHALFRYDNVIITPHNAFNTKEALERILCETIKNINSVAAGKINKENLVK